VVMNSNKNFLVYKSSAGSGKTYTLVKEYLTIALSDKSPERYKNILAITFTNKAAAEMKDRVTFYLKSFCQPNLLQNGEKLMFDNLCESIVIKEGQLQKRSFIMLQSILHNYSDFNITTIDKFILKIIRSFSFDLQLPYNFEVELDGKSLLNQAINNLLSETGKDKKLTAFLVNYIKQLAQNDESWNIQTSLLKIAELSLNEDSVEQTKLLSKFKLEDFVKVKAEIGKDIQKYEEAITNKYKLGHVALKKTNLSPEYLKGKTRGNIWAYFKDERINSKLFTDPAAPTYFKNIEDEEWGSKGNEGNIDTKTQSELNNLFSDLEQYKAEHLSDYVLKQNVHKNLFQLGLLNEIEKQVEIIREEQNFIHISEFNKKVAEVVIEQPIPFIYERIGEKYNNYLIDEFQDTSTLQWQNLLPLLENSLAYNNRNLIVGDAKQAIYRWRGGDVDQFALLPEAPQFADNEIIQERIQTLKRQFNPKNLDSNYRSTKETIQFNNLFFKELLSQLPDFFETYYAEYQQKVGTKKTGGYAQIKLFKKEDYIDNSLDEILKVIRDNDARGRNRSEICVLSRRNADLALIAEHLTKENIEVLSNESLNLVQSPEVNFLVNVFKVIMNNQDIDAIVQIGTYLNREQAVDFLKLFNKNTQPYQVLINLLDTGFDIKLPGISGMSIYEAFEEIISTFSIQKNTPFIQTFLDHVRQKSGLSSASEFIEFWNEKKDKIKIATPETNNAVTLMTIHSSKGLEFPVVILPFANRKPVRSAWLWLDTSSKEFGIPTSLTSNNKSILKTDYSENSEQENLKITLDELNVLYVALTRAAEETYITIEEPSKEPKEIKGIETFFHPVLNSLNPVDDKTFSFGTKTIKDTKNTKASKFKSTAIEIKDLKHENWRSKIKISFSAPAIWNVPQNSEESFIKSDPRKFGNLIHSIFARLNAELNIEETIAQMVNDGMIEIADAKHITALVTNTLKLEPLQSIWGKGKHIIEKEIITKDGSSYRPDRIISIANVTYLIDFKTGSALKKDSRQINNYKDLLTTLNFKNIQTYLIYTEENKSVKV